MKVLNAVGSTPISVLSGGRTQPRKFLSLPTTSPIKFPISANFSPNPPNLPEGLSRSFHGGLVLLSSVLSTGFARALTYEEALQQSIGISDFDASGVLDSVISFGVENPAVLIGGASILAVPLVVSQVFSKSKPWGVESAKNAYAKLADDTNAQLLDIRAPVELRQVGSPDIRGLKKKPVSVVYKGEDKLGFLKKLALKFKEPENTTLVVLDKFDGNSELVAELATSNGFKAAYAIKDGAEGNRGWMNSGLPWILPKKVLSLDFSNLTDAIGDALGEDSDALSVTLGIAAATGLGLLAFSEVETVLELLGSAALVQFISKKFLFAEDRKQTLQQVDEFLNTKVAPKELVDEIKQIGKALLPLSVTSRALPAPAEASPTVTDNAVQKAEAVPELNAEPAKVEAAAELPPQVNSVPKTEVKAESLPGLPRPLSPYPFYPDFKPPTSPTPSQP
uniref:Rhodanese domain-containing protein n=1 Tax=Davidia involucrata TaxID=16924 RepID=A0A5B7A9W2_DAVIN